VVAVAQAEVVSGPMATPERVEVVALFSQQVV
jgi:hypothetical protein